MKAHISQNLELFLVQAGGAEASVISVSRVMPGRIEADSGGV